MGSCKRRRRAPSIFIDKETGQFMVSNSAHMKDFPCVILFREKPEQRKTIMTDQGLKQTVLDELKWEPSVNAAHIGVTARDGVVTLTGHVDSYAEKWAAERSAARVYGVKAMAEELKVQYPSDMGQSDDEIAKRALNVLSWDLFVPNNQVQVKVEKGWVTLSGTLEWYFQKHNAEADVRKLAGVMGITNEIKLKTSVQTSDVKKQIKDALDRSARIESEGITVTADGGKVTLRGKIDSYSQRALVESTAWAGKGVTHVEDLLTIN
jgi:osmotically-inducible protein OsmY